MGNVVNLHGEKRWKAVIVYRGDNGTDTVEHFLEEIGDLHPIIERGPDWETLITCTITLNRPDGGGEQGSEQFVRISDQRG